MYAFFPGNYVWNTATSMALAMGGYVVEIDEACRPLAEASRRNDAAAQEDWFQSWGRLGERIDGLARRDEEAGNALAAGRKYLRAAAYHMMAERMLAPGDPRRLARYANMQASFRRGVTLRREPVEFVEIPYEGKTMPALHVAGLGSGRRPCLIHFDGFDGMKEMLYLMGVAQELRQRGTATIIVDHPGVGEALRRRAMHALAETEKPAGATIDYLATRPDIDASRVGILGISLGGYFAPRAAVFDSRLKCCVAWGASWDYGKLSRERVFNLRPIERSVNHWHQFFQWVFGATSPEEALKTSAKMTMEGVIEKLECPFLIVHGENDRQTPLADAKRVFDAATRCKDKTLRVFTLGEGAAEHCQIDNMPLAVDAIADWVARRLSS
jgi:dienelactone hydrolase